MENTPQNTTYHPVLAISASSICYYLELPARGKKNVLGLYNTQNLTQGKFNGYMSEATRKQLKKKLNSYYEAMYDLGHHYRKANKIHHTIVTLTLCAPQAHSDNEIKRECLSRWLELAIKKFDICFYYWIAEKQKNGNIHFHVLTDRFMEHEWVRKSWNQRLAGLGYIARFEAIHGHNNPNSTDIETIKSLARSAKYVTKYTSKAEQQGGIEGRLHGECLALKSVDKFKALNFYEMEHKIQEWIDEGKVRLLPAERYAMLFGDFRKLFKEDCPKHWAQWQKHQRAIGDLFYG